MTPILAGRWQTRLLLMATIGLLITVIWTLVVVSFAPIIYWIVWLVAGLLLDIIYTRLQKLRWNRDWPPLLQIFQGILEGAIIVAVFFVARFPQITLISTVAYLFTIWALIFFMVPGPMHVLFPKWRVEGNRWISS